MDKAEADKLVAELEKLPHLRNSADRQWRLARHGMYSTGAIKLRHASAM